MTRTYKITKVPQIVKAYFEITFPENGGYTYKFYWYKSESGKIYGCEVYKDAKYWHNATQASEAKFEQLVSDLIPF